MSQSKSERSPRASMAERALKLLDEPHKGQLAKVKRAGLRTLLGAVQRAGSLEEIEIVLRYQQTRSQERGSREDGELTVDLMRHLMELFKTAARERGGSDLQQAQAAAEQFSLIARVHTVVTAGEQRRGAQEDDE
jgi:hypothetical protein